MIVSPPVKLRPSQSGQAAAAAAAAAPSAEAAAVQWPAAATQRQQAARQGRASAARASTRVRSLVSDRTYANGPCGLSQCSSCEGQRHKRVRHWPRRRRRAKGARCRGTGPGAGTGHECARRPPVIRPAPPSRRCRAASCAHGCALQAARNSCGWHPRHRAPAACRPCSTKPCRGNKRVGRGAVHGGVMVPRRQRGACAAACGTHCCCARRLVRCLVRGGCSDVTDLLGEPSLF